MEKKGRILSRTEPPYKMFRERIEEHIVGKTISGFTFSYAPPFDPMNLIIQFDDGTMMQIFRSADDNELIVGGGIDVDSDKFIEKFLEPFKTGKEWVYWRVAPSTILEEYRSNIEERGAKLGSMFKRKEHPEGGNSDG